VLEVLVGGSMARQSCLISFYRLLVDSALANFRVKDSTCPNHATFFELGQEGKGPSSVSKTVSQVTNGTFGSDERAIFTERCLVQFSQLFWCCPLRKDNGFNILSGAYFFNLLFTCSLTVDALCICRF
jgi:hypothetical protein